MGHKGVIRWGADKVMSHQQKQDESNTPSPGNGDPFGPERSRRGATHIEYL